MNGDEVRRRPLVHLPPAPGTALLTVLAQALRILRRTGVEAPAIAVTGNASLADREHLLAVGFASVVVKPCSMADLACALRLATTAPS